MSRHFITVLGTGNYSECVYEMEDGQFACKTPFVQIAVLKYVMPDFKRGDKITVFATEKAEEKNWNTTITATPQNNGGKSKPVQKKLRFGKKTFHLQFQMESAAEADSLSSGGTERKGLDALLQEEFPEVQRTIVRIPEGRNARELNQIFECIYGALSNGETIFFDFTHGLRNLPMQALAVVNYAKVLKRVKVRGLYYGAFELGTLQDDGLRHVQILDMSFCSTLQDWTSAAEAFVKTGSSNQIKTLYQRLNDTDNADSGYKNILNSLYDLTNCLETSRGTIDSANRTDATPPNSRNSIYCACKTFQDQYKELYSGRLSTQDHPATDQPIERLIEYIYRDVKILSSRKLFLERDGRQVKMRYTALGMSAVQWALDKNLIQQGFTALNETIISYICELYNVPAKFWLWREDVRRTVRSVSVDYEDERYPRDVRETYWIPDWKKKNPDLVEKFGEQAKEILLTLPESVFMLVKQIANDRNSLNHFGFSNDGTLLAYDVLRRRLVDRYQRMNQILENTPGITGSV
ncbi:MAG: TIGR02221 family CRISPR-associated protein [Blautia sp.]|nr:TIGR02221 family CRISPR-associated protein [Blautia sp.]